MSERGQIEPASEFGLELTRLAQDAERIVEIGSWLGEGSTAALSKGLVHPFQRMWSVDQDAQAWLAASRFHEDERIRFIKDRTVNVLEELPEKIDLILFDGGDESTDGEFDLLYSRCQKYIALDDINERKNRRQFAALKVLRPMIRECHHDRNGWAIFGPFQDSFTNSP